MRDSGYILLTYVHIAAPDIGILSTTFEDEYGFNLHSRRLITDLLRNLTDPDNGPTKRLISPEMPLMGKEERHRKYDPEFKQEVLRLVAEGKLTFQVARSSWNNRRSHLRPNQ